MADARIVFYGSWFSGMYQWLAGRDDIVKIDRTDLEAALADGRGTLIISNGDRLEELRAKGLETVATDWIRGQPVELLRAPSR